MTVFAYRQAAIRSVEAPRRETVAPPSTATEYRPPYTSAGAAISLIAPAANRERLPARTVEKRSRNVREARV